MTIDLNASPLFLVGTPGTLEAQEFLQPYVFVDVPDDCCLGELPMFYIDAICKKYPQHKEAIHKERPEWFWYPSLNKDLLDVTGKMHVIFTNYETKSLETKKVINTLVRVGFAVNGKGKMLFHIQSGIEKKQYKDGRKTWETFCDTEVILFGHEIEQVILN